MIKYVLLALQRCVFVCRCRRTRFRAEEVLRRCLHRVTASGNKSCTVECTYCSWCYFPGGLLIDPFVFDIFVFKRRTFITSHEHTMFVPRLNVKNPQKIIVNNPNRVCETPLNVTLDRSTRTDVCRAPRSLPFVFFRFRHWKLFEKYLRSMFVRQKYKQNRYIDNSVLVRRIISYSRYFFYKSKNIRTKIASLIVRNRWTILITITCLLIM